jgi:hypothetical protein
MNTKTKPTPKAAAAPEAPQGSELQAIADEAMLRSESKDEILRRYKATRASAAKLAEALRDIMRRSAGQRETGIPYTVLGARPSNKCVVRKLSANNKRRKNQ